MKFCRVCGIEIYTQDGDNLCLSCADAVDENAKAKLRKAKAARKEREAILRSLGLVKVRGAMGGTYWE